MTASEPFDLTDFDHDEPEHMLHRSPVTVRGLDELRTSIPYLLGFYPERSLVALGLARDGSVLLTLRIDAPRTVPQAIDATREIVPVLLRGEADRVVLAYCDDYELGECEAAEREQIIRSARRAYQSTRELEPVLARELAAHGLPSVFVWPKRPGQPRTHDGPVPEIAVAQVLSGRRLLRNRAEVGARLEPASGASRRRVREHIERLSGIPHSRMDLVAMVTDLLERNADALERGHSPAALDPHDAAICAIAVQDVATRDILITLIAQERAWRHEELWCRVVQLAPTDHLAPVATMAAINAYLSGDGALARYAFDLALQHEPDYGLAQMIDASLRVGLHPEQLRSILASTFDPVPTERFDDLDAADGPQTREDPDELP